MFAQLNQRSAIDGRTLNARASAYYLWALCDSGYWDRQGLGFATPPPLDRPAELRRRRAEAKSSVRGLLVSRARDRLRRGSAGEAVLGLRLVEGTTSNPGPYRIGTFPGVYSEQWATPVGGPGEATLAESRELVAQEPARFQLEAMAVGALRARVARVKADGADEPDAATLAEAVAANYSDAECAAAVRHFKRLVREGLDWEYTHPGSESLTGRNPLPYMAAATRRPLARRWQVAEP